jgi:hypothetical protein
MLVEARAAPSEVLPDLAQNRSKIPTDRDSIQRDEVQIRNEITSREQSWSMQNLSLEIHRQRLG